MTPTPVFPLGKLLRKSILKNAYEFTLGKDCLELCSCTETLFLDNITKIPDAFKLEF